MVIEKTIENLNEIKYGWIDKDGNIYKKSTKDFFMNNYHLMSIDEIRGYGVGTSFEEADSHMLYRWQMLGFRFL